MDDLERKVADENIKSVESGENYEFVTETIKKRPVNTKRVIKKVCFTVFLALLFGCVATVTFVVLYPKMYDRIYPGTDMKPVKLPIAEEETVEDSEEEFVPLTDDTDDSITEVNDNKDSSQQVDNPENTETPDRNDNADETGMTDDGKTDDKSSYTGNQGTIDDTAEGSVESGKQEEQVVINQITQTIEKDLELDDYRALLRKMSGIATSTEKSLVTVSGRKSNKDWFNNSYEDNNSSTGIIVADNGKELLIVCPTSVLHGATMVDVTFCDGKTVAARRSTSDANTGLGMVAVILNNIDESTKNIIEMAQFGSFAASSVGIPIVAVGAPYGTKGSVGIGQITSNSTVIDKVDSDVRMISTDIYGSSNASGVLVNYNGRIIGIICHEENGSDMPNLIRAYAAEDITDEVEKISNGQKLATLGIYGTDVTSDANTEYGVPFGAYVKEVIVDSPAMSSGIRNGDVIVKIGIKEIESFDDYKKVMMESQPGDTVNVTLQRPDGEEYTEVTCEVTLEELK